MNKFLERYVNVFTSEPKYVGSECKEDLYESIVSFIEDNSYKSLPADLRTDGINARDVLEIKVFEGNDANAEIAIKYNQKDDDWIEFAKQYTSLEHDIARKIKIRISKHDKCGIISVYDKQLFLNYLNGLSLDAALNIFDNLLAKDCHTFEMQCDFNNVMTYCFAFVKNDVSPIHRAFENDRQIVIQKANQLCYSDSIKKQLLPDDLTVKQDGGEEGYVKWLKTISLLYSTCFLFDLIKYLNSQFEYKLNGFKTISAIIEASSIADINVDLESAIYFYDIFSWVYSGGNTTDKIIIARNIISLNMVDCKTLKISSKTIDAIISNYRIYEKENVKQYISIRNDISKQLRIFQKDIIKTVDEFDNDFKKSYFTFITFVFTTALIRVLAKNIADAIILPDTIIFMLIGYCVLSLCYYFYAKWVLDKKISLLETQYNGYRKFYQEILSGKEIDELFNDTSDDNSTYKVFQNERKTKYQKLWLLGTITMIIMLLFILVSNHWDALTAICHKIDDLYRIFKDCQQCCPHCGQ